LSAIDDLYIKKKGLERAHVFQYHREEERQNCRRDKEVNSRLVRQMGAVLKFDMFLYNNCSLMDPMWNFRALFSYLHWIPKEKQHPV